MVNLCAKFNVTNFTRYEDTQNKAKWTKWGDLGLL